MAMRKQVWQRMSAVFLLEVGDWLDQLLRQTDATDAALLSWAKGLTSAPRRPKVVEVREGPRPEFGEIADETVLGALRFIQECAVGKADRDGPIDPWRFARTDDQGSNRDVFFSIVRDSLALPTEPVVEVDWLPPEKAGRVPKVKILAEAFTEYAVRDAKTGEPRLGGWSVDSQEFPDFYVDHIPSDYMFREADNGLTDTGVCLAPGWRAVFKRVTFDAQPQVRWGEDEWATPVRHLVLFAFEVLLGLHDVPKSRSSGKHSRIGRCLNCRVLFVRKPKAGTPRKYCCDRCGRRYHRRVKKPGREH